MATFFAAIHSCFSGRRKFKYLSTSFTSHSNSVKFSTRSIAILRAFSAWKPDFLKSLFASKTNKSLRGIGIFSIARCHFSTSSYYLGCKMGRYGLEETYLVSR
jgi:hypothetical protein